MTGQDVSTEPLRPLIQALIDGDEGFDRLWLERRDSLAALDHQAQAAPLAGQLIRFIFANLEPLSELPASEGRKLAKRLMRLLNQADRILSQEAKGYSKEVATAIDGVFWPEPAKFEVVIEEGPSAGSKKNAVKKRSASGQSPTKKSTAKKSPTKETTTKKGPSPKAAQAVKAVDEAPRPEQPPPAPGFEETPPASAAVSALFARFEALAEQAEPALLETLLRLMETQEANQWRRICAHTASLLEPFSIAAEMVGFASLDTFYKAMDSGLRTLEMPAREEARVVKIQALADLPGLHAAMFLEGAEAMAEIAAALLRAVDGSGDHDSIIGSLAGATPEIAAIAAEGVMILDAAGIEEMIDQNSEAAGESAQELAQAAPVPQQTPAEIPADGGLASEFDESAWGDPQAPFQADETTAESGEEGDEAQQACPFSDGTMELLGILAAGVSECQEDLERLARELEQAEGEAWEKGVKRYGDLLQRLVLAAETIEFDALHQGAEWLAARVTGCPATADAAQRTDLSRALARLPQALLDFLVAPHNDQALLALYGLFEETGALESLDESGRMAFLEGLSRGPAEDDTPQEAPKVKVADLVLKPDSDADASVLESVANEGPRLAGEFAQLLQQIIAGEEVKENLHRAQRAVHTLKGSANICGIRGIAVLSHHLEDLLEHLGERGEAPDATLASVLVDAADALESALEVVFSGEAHDPKVFADILVKVVGWSYAVRAGETEPQAVALEGAVEETPAQGAEDDKKGALSPGGAQLAPSASLVDSLQKQMGELSIALTQAESRLSGARDSVDQMTDQHIRNLRNVEKLEELADIRGLGTRFSNLFAGNVAASGADYDPLELEEYNELYITTRRLHEGEADAQALAEGLDQAIKVLEELSQIQLRLNHEMQDLIAAARRVPVGQYIPRLQRVVRQTCRATGKAAEMTVEGSELEVDNEVMDKLLPALLHILRNAIDHGIEDRETRFAAGKPESGTLTLGFKRIGNAIEVVFSDDGAGLDYHKVRERALANGMIEEGATPTTRELALLTLKPGFSTRSQVSEISGRGVGMNVVDAAIRELKGALSIDSEAGQGYTLTMRVPTSTISMYTLLVSIGEEQFAIPGSEVRYAAPFGDGEVEEEGDDRYFRYGEERYPLEELSDLIGIKRTSLRAERPIVLIAYSDVDERAVLADSLDDSRVVISKKLGSFVPPIPGVSSATILGDGGIVPILELRRLLRREGMIESLGGFDAEQELAKPPGILIVDDSLSMRKSLSQLVADGGWRAITAVDGIDALRVIEEELPDLVLVDMEMPAMNGLELTRHLRNDAATRHLPIAMITSRATTSHREKALEAGVDHYFIKPYREDEVLEFIEQRLHAKNSGGEEHD